MSEYHQSEQLAINLFKKMGYDYLNAKSAIFEVVLEDRLCLALLRLNPWLSDSNLQKVLRKVLALQGDSLMSINQQLHTLITKADAMSLNPTPSKPPVPVKFIDFENIGNNEFLVVNQMKFRGRGRNSIPDLVVFVNGLPLAVIEAKSQKVSIDQAISDLLYYQDNSPKLFWYNQFCVAINRIDGRYGVIDTPSAFYGKYNQEPTEELTKLLEDEVTPQDILLYNLFEKKRLLDIVTHVTPKRKMLKYEA